VSLSGIEEKFESFIADAMMQDHIPGLSLAVVKDGKLIYAKGFGARNLKISLQATPDTLYGIGSCVKSFTALAIMQLQEQGKLKVDDPVSRYLPRFKIGNKRSPILIHHLLTHSSGIPDLCAVDVEINRFLEGDEKWVPFSTLDDMMRFINGAKDEVAAEPGKRFFYLNEGYVLLGLIIEKATRMHYEDYIKEKILKPLKMNRSDFPNENLERDADVATLYFVQRKENTLVATPSVLPLKLEYAAGGLMSSVKELANYLIAYMNGGVFDGTRVLGSDLLEEMYKPRISVHSSFYGKRGYGYGWLADEDFFGHRSVGHAGSTLVSNANLLFVPDMKMGVAVASNNGAADSVHMIAPFVLALLMGKDPMKRIPTFKIEKMMSMLTGQYESYKGIEKISIVRKGGILFFESKDKLSEQSLALLPEDDTLKSLKFYVPAGGQRMPLEFVVDSSGKIDLYLWERYRFHKTK
jgi:CubicO group peptidase (beta-lactamase class C family)